MIVLFTDYGLHGPYIGQVKVVLNQQSPDTRVITLMADAPACNPKAGAYLLHALSAGLPEDTVIFAVIDPGVGSFEDRPVVIRANSRWYVGPDNGLFDIVARTASAFEAWEIVWRPDNLSDSFHGRDLYAPVCAMISNRGELPVRKVDRTGRHNLPDDLPEIVYIDHFGNCMTGIRAKTVSSKNVLKVDNRAIRHARVFAGAEAGRLFWYCNSIGLVEIAANRADAARILKVGIGANVQVS